MCPANFNRSHISRFHHEKSDTLHNPKSVPKCLVFRDSAFCGWLFPLYPAGFFFLRVEQAMARLRIFSFLRAKRKHSCRPGNGVVKWPDGQETVETIAIMTQLVPLKILQYLQWRNALKTRVGLYANLLMANMSRFSCAIQA